ncbi:hypothetical protein GCM10020218_100390 [Dactylosporangium vinaceum]|uniref:serine/threonine-protein kinase n=1 Tax=Dactylosporangium vinaceum TaxID=53362 RepID=UPI001FE73A08|nr:serine/threonine-protein kinase [Dactylosporangium vinaceum]
MGRVWRARDETLHRDVAVKQIILPPELLDTARDVAMERTLREARAAARLSHPNVVRVYDVLAAEGQPWLVMEYVRSRSLDQVIREDGPLPPRRVAEIGLAVLDALRAAQKVGVDHRDIKPGNVLLAEDGRVVLTDFGIARVEGEGHVTRTGLVLGSPEFIAPERAREGIAGPASDLWSLGATLYTAVEGRSPFGRGSAMETLSALASEEADPPQRAGALTPVLRALLRKDPRARANFVQTDELLRKALIQREPAKKKRSWLSGWGRTEPAAPAVPAQRTPRTRPEPVALSGAGSGETAKPAAPPGRGAPPSGAPGAATAGGSAAGTVAGASAAASAPAVVRGHAVVPAPAPAQTPPPAWPPVPDEEPASAGISGKSGIIEGPIFGTATADELDPDTESQTEPASATDAEVATAADAGIATDTEPASATDAGVTADAGVATGTEHVAGRADEAADTGADDSANAVADDTEAETAVDAAPAVEDEPEPVAAAEEAAAEPEPTTEPQPVTAVVPEPLTEPEPEPVTAVVPEPVTAPEPEPVTAAEPEPVTAVEPEPVIAAEPEPVTAVEPEPVIAAEPEPVTAVEPEPVIAAEPATERRAAAAGAFAAAPAPAPVERPERAAAGAPRAAGQAAVVTRPRQADAQKRRRNIVAGAVAAVLVAAVLVWVAVRSDDDGSVPTAGSTGAAQTTAAGAAPAPSSAGPTSAAATGGASSAPADNQPSATPTQQQQQQPQNAGTASGTLPPLPAGWHDYTDPTGFKVYVPDGWNRSVDDGIVYFRGNGRSLGIDQSDKPKMDPVADWRAQEGQRANTYYKNYTGLRIDKVDNYFIVAADWEFLYGSNPNARQHVNNRGLVSSPHQAYGIWWSTPEGDWNNAHSDLDLVFASFRPKP